jgi:hypothetical protein
MRRWTVRACPECDLLVALEDSWDGLKCDGRNNVDPDAEKHQPVPMVLVEVQEVPDAAADD